MCFLRPALPPHCSFHNNCGKLGSGQIAQNNPSALRIMLKKSSVIIATSNKIASSHFVGKWNIGENTGLLSHR
jgi:hypothetical protein